MRHRWTRREFCKTLTAAGAAMLCGGTTRAAEDASGFKPRYILGSCMYGTMPLAEILPEVRKTGAEHIDIWPAVHGNQREQIEQMGHDAFHALLTDHDVKLGMVTRYDLGLERLHEEMPFAAEFGAKILIAGSGGPKGLAGEELKMAVRKLVENLQPQLNAAEKHGIVIGVENHSGSLVDSPDAVRWLGEFAAGKPVGIALAPYHLPQDPALLASLITDLGDRLVHFYAWQHGMGCMTKLPKEQELLQMPGRGDLDFAPIVAALDKINYAGWTEIFMHPVPRGIPILDTAAEVTAEINRAREYLEAL